MLDADFPNKFQAEIEVHHTSGNASIIRIDQVKGSADRPASVAEIETKFKSNTSARFKTQTQAAVIDLMMQGANDLPVAKLSELLVSR